MKRVEGVKQRDWRRGFYDLNYELIAAHIQGFSPKIKVGPRSNRRCRFCGKSEDTDCATFKLKAHGFPRLVGNTTFFTNYECDDCNTKFGEGIENQLGIYLKPYRVFAAIGGYSDFPIIKSEKDGWRIWRDKDGLHIHHQADKRIAELIDEGKTLAVAIPRDPHRPLDVYKAFLKMALSLIPEDEIANFNNILCWMRDEAKYDFVPPTMSSNFVQGPPRSAMSGLILRRKSDQRELPYMMALFLIANTQFQLMVPSVGKDEHIQKKKVKIPPYPLPFELRGGSYRVIFEELDFAETGIVKYELVRYQFSFDERLEAKISGDDLKN